MASVDWLPHRAQPMEEEATTTHRVTVATATTAGPGTSHRMYTIGKEKEEGVEEMTFLNYCYLCYF